MTTFKPLEGFAGTQLPSWNWYTTEPHSHLLNHPPSHDSSKAYTHTLLFPIHPSSHSILLAHKNRSFAAHTHNGIGGKLHPPESPLQSILRETHEEINVHLSEQDVHFVGRVSIDVDGGEKVCIALYMAKFDEGMMKGVRASEEVEPRWYDVGNVMQGEWWERLPERMRPEHKVYLPVLWYHYVQGEGKVLVDVQVDFDAEPRKENLKEGERPENHRTVRRWSLDILPLSAAADLAAG